MPIDGLAQWPICQVGASASPAPLECRFVVKQTEQQTSKAEDVPGDPAHRAQAAILFTAFEPSGDAHAAPVIQELLRRVPHLRIYAWGGPLMEQAGATILGRTAEDGAMGLSALKRVRMVRREVKRIKQWIKQYRIV